jgi:transcriptional regulator GlxA family with amidase domain
MIVAPRAGPVRSNMGIGTLRRAFHRLVGIAPSDYRDRFRTAYA